MNIQPLLDKIHSHLKARVVLDEYDRKTNDWTRRFAKWWFDLIKNAVVVVALKVLADRSNSVILFGVYGISWFLFTAYCLSYVVGVSYFPIHPSSENRRTYLFSSIIVAAATAIVLLGISVTGTFIIDAIATAQTTAQTTPQIPKPVVK